MGHKSLQYSLWYKLVYLAKQPRTNKRDIELESLIIGTKIIIIILLALRSKCIRSFWLYWTYSRDVFYK